MATQYNSHPSRSSSVKDRGLPCCRLRITQKRWMWRWRRRRRSDLLKRRDQLVMADLENIACFDLALARHPFGSAVQERAVGARVLEHEAVALAAHFAMARRNDVVVIRQGPVVVLRAADH